MEKKHLEAEFTLYKEVQDGVEKIFNHNSENQYITEKKILLVFLEYVIDRIYQDFNETAMSAVGNTWEKIMKRSFQKKIFEKTSFREDIEDSDLIN